MKKWISVPPQFISKNIYNILSWFLSAVLVLAVITKMLDPAEFNLVLIKYTFIPFTLVKPAAAIILGTEALIVLFLLIPGLRRFGAPAAFFLFTGFTVFKAYHFILDTGANCGCFGPLGPDKITFADLMMNVILTVLCGLLINKKA